ncbi:hypothetical protein CASFOL_025604 [Castilleja foliolosa]|uniref:Uncharacterized protein n=1 Tax=Castilleja foliolosa TaxID=1961234 RepID=A0ABD3CVD4_9LAMI
MNHRRKYRVEASMNMVAVKKLMEETWEGEAHFKTKKKKHRVVINPQFYLKVWTSTPLLGEICKLSSS